MFTTSKIKKGFTLVELLTAVSIFVVVMVVSMGSILNVFDANRKTRTLKTVVNNLNSAVESMSKEIRFGTNYHCGNQGQDTAPRNCPNGDTYFTFLSSDNNQIVYNLNSQSIEKRVNNDNPVAITAPELIIDSITFYTLGADTDNSLQPKVIIKIKAHAGADGNRSDFTLQTMVSQRALDIVASSAP